MNTTGSVLVDTTIVVEHLRATTPSIAQRFKEVTMIYLPLTALGELLYGAYNSAFESKSLKHIEGLLSICAILAPGERTAHYYGRTKSGPGAARQTDSAKRHLDCSNWRWSTVCRWPREIDTFRLSLG